MTTNNSHKTKSIMKTFINWRLMISLVIFLVGTYLISMAGNPPDLPAGHGSNSDQNPPGGGAPIASGLDILIGLGGVYAGKKIYDLKE